MKRRCRLNRISCRFVCCVYPTGSAADVLLMQCQSCNCTLLHVVCCHDAHDQGKGQGEDFLNAFHWSANIAKWASTTRSITSSVADTPKRSHHQSTAISGDAMVSNMKSCNSISRSVSIAIVQGSLNSMPLQYTVWGAVPILCATSATGAKRLTWVSISCSIFNVKAITIVPVFFQ